MCQYLTIRPVCPTCLRLRSTGPSADPLIPDPHPIVLCDAAVAAQNLCPATSLDGTSAEAYLNTVGSIQCQFCVDENAIWELERVSRGYLDVTGFAGALEWMRANGTWPVIKPVQTKGPQGWTMGLIWEMQRLKWDLWQNGVLGEVLSEDVRRRAMSDPEQRRTIQEKGKGKFGDGLFDPVGLFASLYGMPIEVVNDPRDGLVEFLRNFKRFAKGNEGDEVKKEEEELMKGARKVRKWIKKDARALQRWRIDRGIKVDLTMARIRAQELWRRLLMYRRRFPNVETKYLLAACLWLAFQEYGIRRSGREMGYATDCQWNLLESVRVAVLHFFATPENRVVRSPREDGDHIGDEAGGQANRHQTTPPFQTIRSGSAQSSVILSEDENGNGHNHDNQAVEHGKNQRNGDEAIAFRGDWSIEAGYNRIESLAWEIGLRDGVSAAARGFWAIVRSNARYTVFEGLDRIWAPWVHDACVLTAVRWLQPEMEERMRRLGNRVSEVWLTSSIAEYLLGKDTDDEEWERYAGYGVGDDSSSGGDDEDFEDGTGKGEPLEGGAYDGLSPPNILSVVDPPDPFCTMNATGHRGSQMQLIVVHESDEENQVPRNDPRIDLEKARQPSPYALRYMGHGGAHYDINPDLSPTPVGTGPRSANKDNKSSAGVETREPNSSEPRTGTRYSLRSFPPKIRGPQLESPRRTRGKKRKVEDDAGEEYDRSALPKKTKKATKPAMPIEGEDVRDTKGSLPQQRSGKQAKPKNPAPAKRGRKKLF